MRFQVKTPHQHAEAPQLRLAVEFRSEEYYRFGMVSGMNERQYPDYLEPLKADFDHRLEQRRAAYALEQQRPAYQREVKRYNRLVADFASALLVCSLQASRSLDFSSNSLLMRSLEDLYESANIVAVAIEQTARNAARRELRYMLELSVKSRLVDQELPRGSFDDKLVFFKRRLRVPGIAAELKHLSLTICSTSEHLRCVEELRAAYGRASQYVHPTVPKIRDRIELSARGITLGFDSADELRSVNHEVFDVLALVLVILFHGIESGPTGELFEGVFDKQPDWLFHIHPRIAAIDAVYDYKAERKERLDTIRTIRQQRLDRYAARDSLSDANDSVESE